MVIRLETGKGTVVETTKGTWKRTMQKRRWCGLPSSLEVIHHLARKSQREPWGRCPLSILRGWIETEIADAGKYRAAGLETTVLVGVGQVVHDQVDGDAIMNTHEEGGSATLAM